MQPTANVYLSTEILVSRANLISERRDRWGDYLIVFPLVEWQEIIFNKKIFYYKIFYFFIRQNLIDRLIDGVRSAPIFINF